MHDMVSWDGPRKFAGGRSYALKGTGALLELAVTRLALDVLVARGLVPIIPPVMVKERALQGTGFFPLGIEEAYAILGLSPGADADAIKEAHRRLMVKLHPDHGGSDYLATQINRARDVLLHR